MEDGPDITTIDDYLFKLREFVRECEEEKKYSVAQATQLKIEEIVKKEDEKRKNEMVSRQLSEQLEIENAHNIEFVDFEADWQSKIVEFEEHAEMMFKNKLQQQAEEMQSLRDKLTAQLPTHPRQTSETLNLVKIRDQLVKRKDYMEAEKVQKRIEKIEKDELVKHDKQRKAKIVNAENKLAAKHKIELQGLEKRIQTADDELKKSRAQEKEKLLLKYQNMKKELKAVQNQEMTKTSRDGFNL